MPSILPRGSGNPNGRSLPGTASSSAMGKGDNGLPTETITSGSITVKQDANIASKLNAMNNKTSGFLSGLINSTVQRGFKNNNFVAVQLTIYTSKHGIKIQENMIIDYSVSRDYITNVTEEILISFHCPLGLFSYDIYPERANLRASLTYYNLDGTGEKMVFNNTYYAFCNNAGDTVASREVNSVDKEQQDKSKLVPVCLTLIPLEFMLFKTAPVNYTYQYKEPLEIERAIRHVIDTHFKEKPIVYNGEVFNDPKFPNFGYDVCIFPIAEDIEKRKKLEYGMLKELKIGANRDRALTILDVPNMVNTAFQMYVGAAGTFLQYAYEGLKTTEVYINTHKRTPVLFIYPIFDIIQFPKDGNVYGYDYQLKKNMEDKETTLKDKQVPIWRSVLRITIPDNPKDAESEVTYAYDPDIGVLDVIAGPNTTTTDKRPGKNISTPGNIMVADRNPSNQADFSPTKDGNVNGKFDQNNKLDTLNATAPTKSITDSVIDTVTSAASSAVTAVGEVFVGGVNMVADGFSYLVKIAKGKGAVSGKSAGNVDMEYVTSDPSSLMASYGNAESTADRSEALQQFYITFDIEWRFGNPELIYPGMPVKIIRMKKIEVITPNPEEENYIGKRVYEYYGRVAKVLYNFSQANRSNVVKIIVLARDLTLYSNPQGSE